MPGQSKEQAMSGEYFSNAIVYLGEVAFAISGIRLAAAKKYDIFGALVVGFVTAVGGGTLRDLLLGIPVFWLNNPWYLICTVIAMVIYLAFRKLVIKFGETILLFDTLGLALFNVIGIRTALDSGHTMLVAVIMGIVTGSAGGLMRDLLTQDPPLILQRKEIYAVACLLGGICYAAGTALGLNEIALQILAISVVVVVRTVSHSRAIVLPYTP